MIQPLEARIPINHPYCLIACEWFYHVAPGTRVIVHVYHGHRAEAHISDLAGEDAFKEAVFYLADQHHKEIAEQQAPLHLNGN